MNKKFNTSCYLHNRTIDSADKVRLNFILSNIPDNNLEIFDVGCCDGSFTKHFKKNTNKAYGIDISKHAVNKAKRKGIIVKEGDFLEKDYFKNIKFDIIVAGETIEHIFDTDLFLKKIYTKLKKNGTLIITTPNSSSLPRRILLLFGKNPFLEYSSKKEHGGVGHIRYFNFDNMHKILENNKFKIIKSESDALKLNSSGSLYSTFIARIYKRFGRTIMITAKKI